MHCRPRHPYLSTRRRMRNGSGCMAGCCSTHSLQTSMRALLCLLLACVAHVYYQTFARRMHHQIHDMRMYLLFVSCYMCTTVVAIYVHTSYYFESWFSLCEH
ncbi:hypothetical protein C2E23DRAFT_821210 [Lenzites betulinus]|nr:hypothetical protein C2E23DRAFT_821210 [Lenzites betulinus]